jgi:hypothetical protein
MRRVPVAILLLLVLTSPALAQRSGTGLGLILGEPTGISFKTWTGSVSAIDAALAWSFEGEDSFHFHIDWMRHDFGVVGVDKGSLPFYYGIGGRLKAEDDSRLGARGVFGFAYLFESAPFDIFLEVVPILDLVPDTDFVLNAAIGTRFFFGQSRR